VRLLLAAVAVALLVSGMAGCVGHAKNEPTPGTAAGDNAPSPAIYKIKPAEEVWVASSTDGKRLNNGVYRPDTDKPVPVYINFSPYHGDKAMDKGDAMAHYLIDEYVPRGFAVVLSSVRGTGHSEGCFQVGGDLELKDTRDVIDYFAKQPWSTGAVAAGAKSYDATTQNGVIAKFPTPNLKGIFHVSGITDMYRYNGKDGVTYDNGLTFTPRYAVGQGTDEYGTPAGSGFGGDSSPRDEDAASLMRLADDVACPELARHASSGTGTAADGLKDAYWQERDWVKSVAASTWNGSIFFVEGLQDWNVKPDDILPWLDEVQKNGHIEVYSWLHQWSQGGTGHVYPMRADWNATMLQWMDHVLKGKDNGWHAGYQVEGSDGTWRASADWPEVPRSTVVNVTAKSNALPILPGTRVSGVPVLHVTATPLTPDPVIHATWYDLDAAAGKLTWVNEAVRRGALTDDLTAQRTIVPGTAMPWTLEFYPMDAVLQPGHAWIIVLGSPSQPTGVAALDAGAPPASQAGFTITPSQEQVQYDEPTMRLELRASDAALGAVDPQPTQMKCFTC